MHITKTAISGCAIALASMREPTRLASEIQISRQYRRLGGRIAQCKIMLRSLNSCLNPAWSRQRYN
jgi:hypothetical protein